MTKLFTVAAALAVVPAGTGLALGLWYLLMVRLVVPLAAALNAWAA